jgi:hypothetical protein
MGRVKRDVESRLHLVERCICKKEREKEKEEH